MKNFTVKENAAFRLRVKSWKCLTPSDLNSIEFIQESLKDGDVIDTSTYNFFMTDEELKTLAQGLVA
jgi:hypothetical protein